MMNDPHRHLDAAAHTLRVAIVEAERPEQDRDVIGIAGWLATVDRRLAAARTAAIVVALDRDPRVRRRIDRIARCTERLRVLILDPHAAAAEAANMTRLATVVLDGGHALDADTIARLEDLRPVVDRSTREAIDTVTARASRVGIA